jgi:AraC-like DNA-binding protein
MAFLFVEPESDAGRALAPEREAICALPVDAALPHMRRLAERFRAGADDAALAEAGKAIVAALAGQPRSSAPDPRVRAMIDYAAANIENAISLPLAAGAAGLSPSRARHVFVEQTGLPFKTYVLWLRIQRAVEIFAAGASLTEAAHEAGFSDSAHLSRTFRRTFGLPAAALRINSRFIQAEGAAAS